MDNLFIRHAIFYHIKRKTMLLNLIASFITAILGLVFNAINNI